MRPPEGSARDAPSGLADSRLLLSRINAGLALVGNTAPPQTSPATGANAVPNSPPQGDRSSSLPSIHRHSSSRSQGGAWTEALDVMRLSFESPSEAAARLKGMPTSSTTPAFMDEGLFSEHDRQFPVPKYLDHSLWRSRMFTYPSPTKLRPSAAAPVASSSSANAYPLLLNATPLAPQADRSPSSKRKFQLAASLAGADSATGDDWTIPLPTCWDQEDRCPLVEVTSDGLEVSFCGSGKNGDRDAAAVRANRHMPSHTGIYYYEIEVVSKGQSGYIAIGFSGLNVKLSRLPGWEAGSWGYHGDDGHSFASQGTGRAYGPTFSTGDIVGCGIDFTRQQAFFTKNGAFLGFVFEALEGQLYPSIGMRTPGEVVRANFGQAPFRFDVESFVISRKNNLLKMIDETTVPERYHIKLRSADQHIPPEPVVPDAEQASLPQPQFDAALDDTIASLVSAYLAFHGFVETAHAFDAQRSADRRRYSDLSSPAANGIDRTEDADMSDSLSDAASGVGVRQRISRAILSGHPQQALDLLENIFPIESEATIGPLTGVVFRLRCQQFVELIVASATRNSVHARSDEVSNGAGSLDDALEYGRVLQAQYGTDARIHVQEGLRRTFALLAYDDPRSANEEEVQWQASQTARDKLADDVNAAILDAQGLSARPVLETVFKQAVVSIAEVGRLGDGKAALIDIRQELFR